MAHPDRRQQDDIPNAVQEFVSSQKLQLHQIVAATHPETRTTQLADQSRTSRQALERKVNDLLSKPIAKKH